MQGNGTWICPKGHEQLRAPSLGYQSYCEGCHAFIPRDQFTYYVGNPALDQVRQASQQSFIHSTPDHEFAPGDIVEPASTTGHASEWAKSPGYDSNNVHIWDRAAMQDEAWKHGYVYPMSDDPAYKHYEVEPLGPLSPDPEVAANPEEPEWYYPYWHVTPRARVTREVPVDELYTGSAIEQHQGQPWKQGEPPILRQSAGTQAAQQVMYHVAPSEHREAIEQEGLRHDVPSRWSDGPANGVYLYSDPTFAENYAEGFNRRPHDIWSVNVDGLPVEPDPEDLDIYHQERDENATDYDAFEDWAEEQRANGSETGTRYVVSHTIGPHRLERWNDDPLYREGPPSWQL